MPRALPEWIGKTDDSRAPKKVRDRLRDAHPRCYLCTLSFEAGDNVALDHVVALINGGENRETNLRPVHVKCHAVKTGDDVAEKARVAARRQSHRGIRVEPVRKLQSVKTISARTKKNQERERMPPPGPKQLYRTIPTWPTGLNVEGD